MSSRRQISNPLVGRCRQVSLYLTGWSLRSPQGNGDMNRGTGWYYINGEYCNFNIIPLIGKCEVFVEVKPVKSSLSNKLRLVDLSENDEDGGSYVVENDKNTHTPTAVTANRIQVFFLAMMTSSNGNIFRITGHLCGEFTGPRWISPHKGQWRGALMFSLIYAWIKGWVNTDEAGDFRRQQAHYDVIVMFI